MKSVQNIVIAAKLISALAGDTTPPVVQNFVYGPLPVTAGNKFSATLTASDESGISHIDFYAFSSGGWYYPCNSYSKPFALINGTNFDGTWGIECNIDSNAPNGYYDIKYAAYDTANNNAMKAYTRGMQIVGGATPEKEGPVIKQATYPSSSAAGTAFTVDLAMTDSSGVEDGYMVIRETVGKYVGCSTDNLVLKSGTATDGVWSFTCVMPSDAPNGEYYLEMHVNDVQNNPTDLYEYHAFNLYGGATPDRIVPSITKLTFDDTTLTRGQTFQFTALIKDADTGVDHVNFWASEPYTQYQFCKESMTLISGTAASGTWGLTCQVPDNNEIDYTYYTASVSAYDKQNNQGYATASFQVVVSSNK